VAEQPQGPGPQLTHSIAVADERRTEAPGVFSDSFSATLYQAEMLVEELTGRVSRSTSPERENGARASQSLARRAILSIRAWAHSTIKARS
jgi:hypothetical protein